MRRTVLNMQTGQVTIVDLTAAEIDAARAASTMEAVAKVRMLTPAQFWMQLAIDGDEAAALAIIDTLPRPQQILATKAKDYRIDDPLLLQLADALGKSAAQIDSFFRKAAKL